MAPNIDDNAVTYEDFEKFLDEVRSLRLDRVRPSMIVKAPFDKIHSRAQLIWIRELLNGSVEEKQKMGIMTMATLEMTHLCKSSLWPIGRGIPILMEDVSTPNGAADIDYYTEQARFAVNHNQLLKGKYYDLGNDYIVKPLDLLNWAERANIPVNKEIALAIRKGSFGGVALRVSPSQSKRERTIERDRKLQERAEELKRRNPTLSKNEIAKILSKENFGIGYHRINHIIQI